MVPGANPSSSIYICPPVGTQYNNSSEVGAEYIADPSLSYHLVNGYGYYYPGLPAVGEWNGNDNSAGIDGDNFNLSADHLQYGYYTPAYGYTYPSVDQFNPYMTGAVVTSDGLQTGAQQYIASDGLQTGAQQYIASPQQYFASPLYQSSVAPSGYYPVYVQPSADYEVNMSWDSPSVRSSTYNAGRSPSVTVKARSQVPPTVPSQNATPAISDVKLPQDQNTSRTFDRPDSAVTTSGKNVDKAFDGKDSTNLANNSPLKADPCPATSTMSDKVGSPAKMVNSTHHAAPELTSSQNGIILSSSSSSNSNNKNSGDNNTKSSSGLNEHSLSTSGADAPSASSSYHIIIYRDNYNKEDFVVDYPDAKFFVIKSYSEDDVHKSIKHNVWSSTPSGNRRLDSAYSDAQRKSPGNSNGCPIFLFFSVNMSGQFCGVAEMVGPVDFVKDMDFWQQDKWPGSFPVKWHMIKDVPNSHLRHVILENNENKPVTSSRDTQEIPYKAGIKLLKLFKDSPLTTSVLDDYAFYEDRQRSMLVDKCRRLGRSFNSSMYISASVAGKKSLLGVKKAEERVKVTIRAPPSQPASPVTEKAEHSIAVKELKKDAVPTQILKRGDEQFNENPKNREHLVLSDDLTVKDCSDTPVENGKENPSIPLDQSVKITTGAGGSLPADTVSVLGDLSTAEERKNNMENTQQNKSPKQAIKLLKANGKGGPEPTPLSSIDDPSKSSDNKKVAHKSKGSSDGKKKTVSEPISVASDNTDATTKSKLPADEKRNGITGNESIPVDVVKVGSLHIKVNGASEPSSKIFEPRGAKSDKQHVLTNGNAG